MYRRGFTLLELLIVIGLVMAIGALVWPAMMNSQRNRIFDSTVEIVRDQLLLARAYAQASGKPIEVIYQSDPSRIEARMFEPILRAMQENGSGILVSTEQDDDFASIELDDEQLEESIIAEPWAYRIIAGHIQIRTRPQDDGSDDRFSGIDDFGDFADKALFDIDLEPQPRNIRLAIFLGDGSALLGNPFWIIDSDGRQGRIVVNPWTGIASYEQGSVYRNDIVSQDEEEFNDLLKEDSAAEQAAPPDTEPSITDNNHGNTSEG